MKVPPHGWSIEQLCHYAIREGVHVLIGCHKDDVAAAPPVVTVQIQDASGKKNPEAFRFELVMADPRANMKLCHLIREGIERMKPSKLRLIAPRY